jgi:hypothetical protein
MIPLARPTGLETRLTVVNERSLDRRNSTLGTPRWFIVRVRLRNRYRLRTDPVTAVEYLDPEFTMTLVEDNIEGPMAMVSHD